MSVTCAEVKSGKWVHQNTGRKKTESKLVILRARTRGLSNPNSSGMTDDEYIEQAANFVKQAGSYSTVLYKKYCSDNNLVYIKSFSKNRFGGVRGIFLKQLEEYCNNNDIFFN